MLHSLLVVGVATAQDRTHMTRATHRQFVEQFIVATKRDDFAKPEKLQAELRDTSHFVPEHLTRVPKSDESVEAVLRWFEARGATARCLVVVGGAHAGELAALEQTLREAMFSGEEYLLFSPKGACAYYEHHQGERYFLSPK